MGINITQFAPPGKVSNLVWDDDMKSGAGKIFKGDLTGNVTGDVTGYLLRGCSTSVVSGDFTVCNVNSASASFVEEEADKRLDITEEVYLTGHVDANNIFSYVADKSTFAGSVALTIKMAVPRTAPYATAPKGDVLAGTLTLYAIDGTVIKSIPTPAVHVEGAPLSIQQQSFEYAEVTVATLTTDLSECGAGLSHYQYVADFVSTPSNAGLRPSISMSQPAVVVYGTGLPAVPL